MFKWMSISDSKLWLCRRIQLILKKTESKAKTEIHAIKMKTKRIFVCF